MADRRMLSHYENRFLSTTSLFTGRKPYESREELLNACHETVLKEIERMKKSHE